MLSILRGLRQEERDLLESSKKRLWRHRLCRFFRLFQRRSRKKFRRNSPSNWSNRKKSWQLSPNQRKSNKPLKPNTYESDTKTAHGRPSRHNSSCRRLVRLRPALQTHLTVTRTRIDRNRVPCRHSGADTRSRLRPRLQLSLRRNLGRASRDEFALPEIFLARHDPTRDPTHITPHPKRSLGLHHLPSSRVAHRILSQNASPIPIFKLHSSRNRFPYRNSRNLHLAEIRRRP